MRLTELIGKVDAMRVNQVPDDVKRAWVSEVELLLINEVILTHELPEWVAQHELYERYLTSSGRELLFNDYEDSELIVPSPYDDLYYWWLVAKIDMVEGNMDRYRNDYQSYNNACLTYKDWYNRTYMPIRKTKSFMRGNKNVFTGSPFN